MEGKTQTQSMEKTRRKRVNTSLEQLRALLPFSSNMKRDMASMLEQAVEYINTMHTVLNQEEPACLSKIYEVYQAKVEETEGLRKSARTTKKKESPSPSVYSGPTTSQDVQQQYPQGYGNNNMMPNMEGSFEPDLKRRRSNNGPMFGPGTPQMQQNMLPPINCGSASQQCQSHAPQHYMDPSFQPNNPGPSGYHYYPYGFVNAPRPNSFYNASSNMQGNMFGSKQNEGCFNGKVNSPYSKLDNIPKPSLIGHSSSVSPNTRNMDFLPMDMMNMQNPQLTRSSTPLQDINANYIGMVPHNNMQQQHVQQHCSPCITPPTMDEKMRLKMTSDPRNEFRSTGNHKEQNRQQEVIDIPNEHSEFQNQCLDSPANFIVTSISKQPITPIFNSVKFSVQSTTQVEPIMKNAMILHPEESSNEQLFTPSPHTADIKTESADEEKIPFSFDSAENKSIDEDEHTSSDK